MSVQLERSYWLSLAVQVVLHQSEARHLAHRARRGPCLAELASFPTATWIARLELMIASGPEELLALEKWLLTSADREVFFSGSPKKKGELSRDDLREILLVLSRKFPGSFSPDSLAAHRAMEICRDWASGSPAGGLLLAVQGQLALISTVGLRGGTTMSMWHSLIGPRASSLVSLVQRKSTTGESSLTHGTDFIVLFFGPHGNRTFFGLLRATLENLEITNFSFISIQQFKSNFEAFWGILGGF